MRYILNDTANIFFRARHVASRNEDPWVKVGMSLHITLASINAVVRAHQVDHVIFCLEGRSWRKDFYKPYKANRVVDKTSLTEKEIEEDKLFWDAYSQFTTFLNDKTNASVLRQAQAEADDIIARFIYLHPDDEIIINSSDTDFDQLISEKVSRYNGITGELFTINGILNNKGKPVIDKKTKLPKTVGDPAFVLFEKVMRGDSTDNVFSAYPGVRTKGSKNKVGLIEAFEDRHKQGFSWNNLMLQRWTDHNGVEHKVRDDYERNTTLIDLKAQPDNIKHLVDTSITDSLKRVAIGQVGMHLLKFCGKFELTKISEQADTYSRWLSQPYVGPLLK